MDQLRAFLERHGRRTTVRWWLGARPDVRVGRLPRAIAAMVGYPAEPADWPDDRALTPIERPLAAELLAFLATRSLAWDRGPARASHRAEAAAALAELGPDAVFLANTADWVTGGPVGWSVSLTNATFEAGLIAYDAGMAMICWAEEED